MKKIKLSEHIKIMNTKNQFEAQKKARAFQEMYYPSDGLLKQHDQSEAIRFAFAQGFEMAQKAIQESELEDFYSNNSAQ